MSESSIEVQESGVPTETVVVIGTGPVGIRFVEELLKRQPNVSIVIYGDEPWEPYNRVQLSALLAGDVKLDSLRNTLPQQQGIIHQHHNCPVVLIDTQAQYVEDIEGRRQSYDKLVLATGSRPHLPNIEGIEAKGVYTFRNLTDVEHLLARSTRSRRLAVLGGGLLGVETAKAMQRGHTEVTLIHHSDRLMSRQLDEQASALLEQKLSALQIVLLKQQSVQKVLTAPEVTGLQLRDGQQLSVDTVIVATGIKPNIDLAQTAGIAFGRGFSVNDCMQTSVANVYAVGECAEHRGVVYGVVAPGFEQAAIAAHHIDAMIRQQPNTHIYYPGSLVATRLKVIGEQVFSMGDVAEQDVIAERAAIFQQAGVYRKIVLRHGHLVGAIIVGACDEVARLQEAILERRRIWPWQLWQYRRTGLLWPSEESDQVAQWPANTLVCNCVGVTRGELSEAMAQGCTSLASVQQCTRASTVCGSCKPLVEQLLNSDTVPEAPKWNWFILISAMLALLAGCGLLLSDSIPYTQSVQSFAWDQLWLDGLFKQISGFTILALTIIALLMSARKRLRWFKWGDFNHYRSVHLILGLLVIGGLLMHTGAHLGENLNQWLMLNFMLACLVGAGAGVVLAAEQKIGGAKGRRWRRYWGWLHIMVTWPLPALLGFHILSVYYF